MQNSNTHTPPPASQGEAHFLKFWLRQNLIVRPCLHGSQTLAPRRDSIYLAPASDGMT